MLNGKSVATPNPAPNREAGVVTCARTYDGSVLRQFYGNPAVWGPMQCDGSPDHLDIDFDELAACETDACIFVTASVNGKLAGLFMFHATTPHCYDIHSALLPEFWGHGIAPMLGRHACRWLMENTQCQKVTTSVPTFNESARRMALAAGMQLEGCNRGSFMKDGVLYDQLLLGFTKEELLCL
jgi:RimJ/RimL family protein N-acetyltransferase